MKKTVLFLTLLIGILALSPILMANTQGGNDVKLAVVNFPSLLGLVEDDEDIESVAHDDVDIISQELGYEYVVNLATLELYLEGVLDTISDFGREDITEDVIKILNNEGTEDFGDDFEEVEEIMDLPQVIEITHEIFNEL